MKTFFTRLSAFTFSICLILLSGCQQLPNIPLISEKKAAEPTPAPKVFTTGPTYIVGSLTKKHSVNYTRWSLKFRATGETPAFEGALQGSMAGIDEASRPTPVIFTHKQPIKDEQYKAPDPIPGPVQTLNNEMAVGHVFAVEVPPGEYEFYDYELITDYGTAGNTKWEPNGEFSISFIVKPHQLNYIGEVVIAPIIDNDLMGDMVSASGTWGITPASEQRDRSELEVNYPNLNWESFEVVLPGPSFQPEIKIFHPKHKHPYQWFDYRTASSEELLKKLNSTYASNVRNATVAIHQRQLYDKTTLNAVNHVMQNMAKKAAREEAPTPITQDTILWLGKTLAASREDEYEKSLQQVVDVSQHPQIKQKFSKMIKTYYH